MADKEKEAYWKGRSDSDRHTKHTSIGNVLGELISGTCWQPPRGHEEAYRQGWKDAERDRKDC